MHDRWRVRRRVAHRPTLRSGAVPIVLRLTLCSMLKGATHLVLKRCYPVGSAALALNFSWEVLRKRSDAVGFQTKGVVGCCWCCAQPTQVARVCPKNKDAKDFLPLASFVMVSPLSVATHGFHKLLCRFCAAHWIDSVTFRHAITYNSVGTMIPTGPVTAGSAMRNALRIRGNILKPFQG